MSTQPLPNAPTPQPLHPNSAVAQCLQLYRSTYQANIAIRQTKYDSRLCASEAYRNAMPPLDGHDNIRDFVACVAHGVLIGAIDHKDSSKLLYAAQVALGLLRLKLAPLAAAQNPPAADQMMPG